MPGRPVAQPAGAWLDADAQGGGHGPALGGRGRTGMGDPLNRSLALIGRDPEGGEIGMLPGDHLGAGSHVTPQHIHAGATEGAVAIEQQQGEHDFGRYHRRAAPRLR